MAIEIREFIGCSMNITESAVKRPVSLKENFNEIGPISKNSIIQIIEGIHVGPTRNFTWYTDEALVSSIPSWTKPYQRPLIMHHNETDGKTIGRILHVEHKAQGTRSGTPALEFTCNVPDKDGIEQIKDGRLKTVSIGVIAHDVRCSICGEQIEIIDEEGNTACGHARGASYDDQVCYWKIYKMEAKELSYVIVPSDIYAHNIKTIDAAEYTKTHIKEGVAQKMSKQVNLTEGAGQMIDEEVKDTVVAGTANPMGEEAKEEAPVTEEPKEEAPAVEEPAAEDAKGDVAEEMKKVKEELEEKEASLTEKIKEIETLLQEKEDAEAAAKKANEDLADALEKIKSAEEVAVTAKAELKSEAALREAAEAELIKAKISVREAKESEFNTLRQALNKEVVVKESLSARSDDSLSDAIVDLKEEFKTGLVALKTIQEAATPLLDTQKIEINNRANVKEHKTVGNINVEEGLKDVFSNMFNPRYY